MTYINWQAARLISWLEKDPEKLVGKNIWKELPELVGSKVYEEQHRPTASPFEFTNGRVIRARLPQHLLALT